MVSVDNNIVAVVELRVTYNTFIFVVVGFLMKIYLIPSYLLEWNYLSNKIDEKILSMNSLSPQIWN